MQEDFDVKCFDDNKILILSVRPFTQANLAECINKWQIVLSEACLEKICYWIYC